MVDMSVLGDNFSTLQATHDIKEAWNDASSAESH
jgi:hypothetical protein